MTQVTLNLDDAALREATVQAIMGTLTPEVRAELLQNALTSILTTPPGTSAYGYSKPISPIQRAFNEAVDLVAQQEAKRLVSEDADLRAKMQELLRKVADKVLATDMDKMAENMANSFVASMRRD